jgi:uncharacterized protein
MMSRQDRVIVERFKALVSQQVRVREVLVFGSRARGDAGPESDLDLLVVVDSLDRAVENYVSECAWEAGFPEDVVLTPVTVTSDTLHNSPMKESVFVKNIYRDGIRI